MSKYEGGLPDKEIENQANMFLQLVERMKLKEGELFNFQAVAQEWVRSKDFYAHQDVIRILTKVVELKR